MFTLGAHITACVVGEIILFFVIFYSELLYTLYYRSDKKHNNQDANDLDTMNIKQAKAGSPFQLKIARIINKTKALFE